MEKAILKKMHTEFNNPIEYSIMINGIEYKLNDYIGKNIYIEWQKKVICHCGKEFSKFYRASFCYKCYWNSPLASQSIFKPELCTAHLGIEERDLAFEKKLQLADHYVYLANSSGLKVGITRSTQVPTRWIDQGASQAIILALVPNRRFSGDIEVILKDYVKDKTNWRKMLSSEPDRLNLKEIKKDMIKKIPNEYQKYIYEDDSITNIYFPILKYPHKIKSLKLEKNNLIEGKINGIKGQYIFLDSDRVFNIRSHEGFIVNIDFN
tara:strand:- start:7035 stop:7829 length:795 start_codon:yes stop_codon:yes gene_type:complete